jgi:hypothetical protein
MTDDAKAWTELAAKLRKALGLASPTPNNADAEMAAAGEIPMSEAEIARIANAAAGSPSDETIELDTDYSRRNEVETGYVSEEMPVLSRNRGEDDSEVKRRIEELRKKALEDDEGENGESELEDS